MDKILLKVFQVISFVLIGLAVIFQVIVLIKGEDGLAGSSVLDNYIRLAYVATIITAVLAILFPILFMVQNPKNSLRLLGVIVVFGIIGFICYSLAGNDFSAIRLENLETTEQVSKTVGAALIFTYVIGGLAVVSIIFSGIAGLFK